MFISEEIQQKLMDELYEKTQNWSQVYEQIQDLVKKELELKTYSSIDSNYRCIFLYHVINKQIDMKEFKETVNNMFNITEKDKFHLEFTFDRFFNYRSTDITYKGYFQPHLCTDPIKPSIWDHIYYTFHDWNETGLIINKKNLPYLQAILELAPAEHIGALYEGRFPALIDTYMSKNKTEEILPLLSVIKQNPAFDIDGKNKHDNFINTLIYYLYHLSYNEEIPDAKNIMCHAIEQIKTIYPDFEDIIASGLITQKNRHDGKEKIEINVNCLKVSSILDMQKTVENLDKCYHKCYLDIAQHHDIESDSGESYRAFKKLSEETDGSISVYMDEAFDFDLTAMDISRNYVENFIYLKVLETQIKKGHFVKIPNDYENYLINYPDDKLTKRFYFLWDDEGNQFKNYILDHMQYSRLERTLPIHEEKENNSKLKI